jgi:uncharacterized protein (TIGR02391 family)
MAQPADASAAIRAVEMARRIEASASALGLSPEPAALDHGDLSTFDEVVDDDELRATCRKLYLDGHYAMAVEEAFKCVNNIVKRLSGGSADGAALMRSVFSANNPSLKLNGMMTQSERDQQQGYMDIFAGAMTGIRNPRAHEHAYLDDPRTALELLALANHLARMARGATRS